MLNTSNFRDDLDVVTIVHTPAAEIDVDPPSLPMYIFDSFSGEGNIVHHQLYASPTPFR